MQRIENVGVDSARRALYWGRSSLFFEMILGTLLFWGRDDNDMQLTSKLSPQPNRVRGLFVLVTVVVAASLLGAAAQAQNLDEGKSAQKLFSDGCATCHKSPVGLAKGRMQITLYSFLQDHYTTGNAEASSIAAYLASVDVPPGRRSKAGATTHRKPKPPAPDQAN
jgi:hypothetical protein